MVVVGIVVAALVACVVLVAASARRIRLTPPGSTLQTAVGKMFQIAVESNPSTGYSWSASFDKASLELVKTTFKEGSSGLVGAPGVQVFEFKGLKKGSFEVKLDYLRPWEGQSIKQATYTVMVK
jgi:inhibitor of cysteine peptidase